MFAGAITTKVNGDAWASREGNLAPLSCTHLSYAGSGPMGLAHAQRKISSSEIHRVQCWIAGNGQSPPVEELDIPTG